MFIEDASSAIINAAVMLSVQLTWGCSQQNNCDWHLLAARTDQKSVFICSLVKRLLLSRTPCLVSFIILTFVQLCSILFAAIWKTKKIITGYHLLSFSDPLCDIITVAISRLAWLMSMFPKWWHHCLKNNKTLQMILKKRSQLAQKHLPSSLTAALWSTS